MMRLRRLWRGELPLAVTFWQWAVFGGLLVNIATSILFVVLVTADRPLGALLAGYALSVPYNIVVIVAVWRSAGHYQGDPVWAASARIVTLAGLLLLSVT